MSVSNFADCHPTQASAQEADGSCWGAADKSPERHSAETPEITSLTRRVSSPVQRSASEIPFRPAQADLRAGRSLFCNDLAKWCRVGLTDQTAADLASDAAQASEELAETEGATLSTNTSFRLERLWSGPLPSLSFSAFANLQMIDNKHSPAISLLNSTPSPATPQLMQSGVRLNAIECECFLSHVACFSRCMHSTC